jgi:hypothetical protein
MFFSFFSFFSFSYLKHKCRFQLVKIGHNLPIFRVMLVSGLSLIVKTGCATTSTTTTFEQVQTADVVSVQREINHANNYVYEIKPVSANKLIDQQVNQSINQ